MRINNTLIQVVRGSLIEQRVDVIVNAAKPTLKGGGGIDGVIHEAAGEYLALYEEANFPTGTSVGKPVITPAFNLPHKAIIHVPGPIWQGGNAFEAFDLKLSYLNSLALGDEFKFKSIAFCSISTGIYAFPLDFAAAIAISAAIEFVEDWTHDHNYTRILFAMYGEEEYNVFSRYLKSEQKERQWQRRVLNSVQRKI